MCTSQVSQVVVKHDPRHALNTFQKFTGVTDSDTVYLEPGGFVVDFAPYEWASYAQGFLDYRVSFSSVDSILDKNSSFWRSLNDQSGFPPADHRTSEQAKITSLGYTPSPEPEDSTTVAVGNGDYLTAWIGIKSDDPTGTSSSGSFTIDYQWDGRKLNLNGSFPKGYFSNTPGQ